MINKADGDRRFKTRRDIACGAQPALLLIPDFMINCQHQAEVFTIPSTWRNNHRLNLSRELCSYSRYGFGVLSNGRVFCNEQVGHTVCHRCRTHHLLRAVLHRSLLVEADERAQAAKKPKTKLSTRVKTRPPTRLVLRS